MAIYNHEYGKWATSKSAQLSTKLWVKLLLLLENALKLGGPLIEDLNPLQGPTLTLIPSSTNTHAELVKKLHMDSSWHALNSML